jgi:protein involved in sex pheromone biosynthesis
MARPTGWHLAASPMRGCLDEQRGPVVTHDKCKSYGHQLTRYDAACRALAALRSVDEAKDIRDKPVAMAIYRRHNKPALAPGANAGRLCPLGCR